MDDYDEFVKLWKEYYPEEKKWYNFGTAKYRHELFFFFDAKQMCSINENEKQPLSDHRDDKVITGFLDWLLYQVKYETEKLRKDTEEYNRYLERNLAYRKRLGRIKRSDLWNILKEYAVRLNERLGDEKIEKLKEIVRLSGKEEKDLSVPRMTAEDFFRYCEICYDANDYFKGAPVSLRAKEKYLKMADGRDAGLRDIKGDSPAAFNDWYFSGRIAGSHPWEICRGGNSTHISLFVYHTDHGWILRLSGSSVVRVEETVKMAVALYEKNILFVLSDADSILQMVTGNDFIGIVPDYIFPGYCHALFPKEDKINDFMHLPEDNIRDDIVAKAFWYPLKKIGLDPACKSSSA